MPGTMFKCGRPSLCVDPGENLARAFSSSSLFTSPASVTATLLQPAFTRVHHTSRATLWTGRLCRSSPTDECYTSQYNSQELLSEQSLTLRANRGLLLAPTVRSPALLSPERHDLSIHSTFLTRLEQSHNTRSPWTPCGA